MPAISADPALLFPNPPLDSLTSTFAPIALRHARALKFPAEVAPFAALLQTTPDALTDLHTLLQPAESTFVVSFEPLPAVPGLTITGPIAVRQFEFPTDAPLPPIASDIAIEPLTCAHAAEMVELTNIAFPGFFRIGTCAMGPYFGIRDHGRLLAMCGERMNIRTPSADFREISGLCTHPDFRGRGYAPALLARLLHNHRTAGLRSFLHAGGNPTAIALYERLGFLPRGQFPLYSVRRDA